jgi:hypothetical protein
MNEYNKNVHSPPKLLSGAVAGRMQSRAWSQAAMVDKTFDVDPPYSIITMNSPSCSSLVSAITLDDETFGKSARAPPPLPRESTKNASFDIKPLQPVREPSLSSLSGAPASRRYKSKDVLLFSGVKRVSRFDLVCQTSTAGLYSPSRGLERIKTMESSKSMESTCMNNKDSSDETFLNTYKIASAGKYTSESQQTGQIKSMFPLAKPMRRDVSGATMSIVHKNNICTISPTTGAATHNASIWTFPAEKKVSNPFLTGPLISFARRLPQDKGFVLPSQRPKRTTNVEGGKDVLPEVEPDQIGLTSIDLEKTAGLQKSKSSGVGTNKVTPNNNSFGSTFFTSSPPIKVLRYRGLRRFSRFTFATEEQFDTEASTHTHSGHKRTNIKPCNSTNSIFNMTSNDTQVMKRLRRHSSPWMSSSPNADKILRVLSTESLRGLCKTHSTDDVSVDPSLPPSLCAKELSCETQTIRNCANLQKLPSHSRDVPPGDHPKDLVMGSSFSSIDQSQCEEHSFTATPSTLRRTSLLRFVTSHHGDDMGTMIVPPRRQDSGTDLYAEDGIHSLIDVESPETLSYDFNFWDDMHHPVAPPTGFLR